MPAITQSAAGDRPHSNIYVLPVRLPHKKRNEKCFVSRVKT